MVWFLDLLGIDDLEMDDDARPHFPCPFCYENFDVMSLCSHLEDEHSCETRVTVFISPFCYLGATKLLFTIHLRLGRCFFSFYLFFFFLNAVTIVSICFFNLFPCFMFREIVAIVVFGHSLIIVLPILCSSCMQELFF